MSLPDLDEDRRLARLTALQALQRAHPADFSDLVALGKQVLHVPIISVSLIDGDYQHHIASEGLPDRVPLDQTFCTYTVRSDSVMVVPDTQKDPRFAQHPFVTGKPHLRFYAGAPITYEPGVRLGTVCIADARPRQLSPGNVLLLEHLANLAVGRFRRLLADEPAALPAVPVLQAAECVLPVKAPAQVRRMRS